MSASPRCLRLGDWRPVAPFYVVSAGPIQRYQAGDRSRAKPSFKRWRLSRRSPAGSDKLPSVGDIAPQASEPDATGSVSWTTSISLLSLWSRSRRLLLWPRSYCTSVDATPDKCATPMEGPWKPGCFSPALYSCLCRSQRRRHKVWQSMLLK